MTVTTREHYDLLIDENNDPARDPEPLQAYMDKWDGEPFLAELQLSPDKSVLEIGVGTGRLAMRVQDKCKRFTGIDISPKTIARAEENLGGGSDLVCGDFLSFEFSEKFDVIYSSLTFMHIYNKRAAIQKTASILNSGGRFVLSIDKNTTENIDYGDRSVDVYPDSAEEISALLSESGFTIEKQFETEFAVIFSAVA
ncbi:MAG: class I SAM-dependent methyltransferase [Oscillospiraceae bacterium]|jgi:predicted TPR repeat methyltransferase|nr:class I SAM-dependent methyltransferase [Oscillospiraceae bacterium]